MAPPKITPFSEWLNRQMAQRGLRNSQVAIYADVSHTTVRRWRDEGVNPEPESCQKLAEYFNVPLDMLLALAGHRPNSEPIRPPEIFAAHADKLTDDQWTEVIKYAEWLIERDKRSQ